MPQQKNPGVPEGSMIISISSPFGGWVSDLTGKEGPHYTGSVEGVQPTLTKPLVGQYAESDGVTLFPSERLGHMAPGGLFGKLTDSGGHVNQLALNGGASAFVQGNFVSVLKNGRLVYYTTSALTNHYDPFGGTLSHSTLSGGSQGTDHTGHTIASNGDSDMIIMYDLANPSVEYTISSWEDGTDADVMVALSTGAGSEGSTIFSGWLSSVSASSVDGVNSSPGPFTYPFRKGVPHKMCIGPDGNLYILNGSYVEQVILNGGLLDISKTSAGFELPLGAGWTAFGICSYKNYVAIIASSNGTGVAQAQTAVFLWTGISQTVNGVVSIDPQYSYPIPDNVGQGIYFDGYSLYAFTSGRNFTSKIFQFAGSKGFEQIFESGFISPTNSSLQGSIESYQKGLVIGGLKNSQGRMFRLFNAGFHDEGVITDGTNSADSVGMLKNLFVGTLFAGIHYGSTYAIYTSNASSQTGSQIRSILFTEGLLGRRVYPLGFKGTMNRMWMYLSQWLDGSAVYISLFKDFTQADPGNASFGTDLLNILIDTNTSIPNGDITGTNYFGGSGYRHYAYPSGTTEIDISDISVTDLSSCYAIISWVHASGASPAIIRRWVGVIAPSQ